MTQTSTLLLVDDHPVVREGLNFLLAEQPDFEVVGEADSPDSALAAVERLRPQVLVLDLSLGGQEAMPLVGQIRRRFPEVRILVLSMHDELLYAERLLGLGARGYVMKQEPPAEFLRALRRVAGGEIHVSQAVTERLLARVRANRHAAPAGTANPLGMLTRRERDVLKLVAKGLGTQEISRALAMSPKTVDSHRRNIREKLGLANPRELVRYAARWAESADGSADGDG